MPDRPNIVFIMADDHAPHGLSCYGSPIVQTPRLDALAAQGMRFTRAYDTVALCGPSRASLITGKYCHLHGFKSNASDDFDGSQPTFPKLLQKSGYKTALFGKWHLGSQPTGFDHYSVIPGHGRFWDCPFMRTGKSWSEPEVQQGYLTEVITDQALAWIRRQGDASEPFCAMIHHKAPHVPHEYPQRYEQLYRDDLPLPDSFDDNWFGRGALRRSDGRWSKFANMIEGDLRGNELGEQPIPSREDSDAFKRWAYQVFMKGYLRLVATLDESVGRVMDFLDERGLADNTLLIYTSDNGFFLGEHGLYNKMWMYQESLGLPFLVRLPGRAPAASVCHEMVSLIDLAPTFLDYAQAPIPSDLQGQSMRPLLEGNQAGPFRELHYYHYYGQYDVPSHCGITTRTHKLICFYDQPPEVRWELYDLQQDPQELNNLLAYPPEDQPQQRLFQELQATLIATAKQLQDPVEL